MTLRLSSQSTSSLLSTFTTDPNISSSQKATSLKTLITIFQNILDPSKTDEKYNRIKSSNQILKQRIYNYTPLVSLLLLVGFEKDEGEEMFVFKGSLEILKEAMKELDVNLQLFQTSLSKSDSTSSSKPISTSTATTTAATLKMSEKQKARLLLQEKERQLKIAEKENRKRNLQMLKEDKIARSDPNWKPKVSAACAKTGKGLQTFRDKYGE